MKTLAESLWHIFFLISVWIRNKSHFKVCIRFFLIMLQIGHIPQIGKVKFIDNRSWKHHCYSENVLRWLLISCPSFLCVIGGSLINSFEHTVCEVLYTLSKKSRVYVWYLSCSVKSSFIWRALYVFLQIWRIFTCYLNLRHWNKL
jgi:hypothetical protein